MLPIFAQHMDPKKRNIPSIVAIVLILVGLYIVFDRTKKETVSIESVNTSDTSTTTQVNLGDGVIATVPKGYVFESVDTPTSNIPSLDRPIVFASNIDESVQKAIQTKVLELQKELKKDSSKVPYWIDLGTYHKVAGDFSGAKIYWDYAGKRAPTDFISFGNLGNMYAYQLKDMVNAEKYYNQAIKNAPAQIYLYAQLAEAFRDVSKDIAKARAVVDKGLTANPNSPELTALKESLK